MDSPASFRRLALTTLISVFMFSAVLLLSSCKASRCEQCVLSCLDDNKKAEMDLPGFDAGPKEGQIYPCEYYCYEIGKCELPDPPDAAADDAGAYACWLQCPCEFEFDPSQRCIDCKLDKGCP